MKSYRKKGSSLILVLIVISVLSILGMATISLAVSNYKYRVVKGEVKKSLYASEAGIDESYKIINIRVQEAIKAGNKEVEDFTKKEMDKEIEKEKKKDVAKKESLTSGVLFEEEKWDSSYPGSEYIDVNNKGFITTLLEAKQKLVFSEKFRSYVVSNLVTTGQVLNGAYEYRSDKLAPKVKVDSGSLPLTFIKSIVDESKYILNVKLESTFINKDGIKKVISAEYEILTPEYGQNYSVAINTIKIPNMVWSKAIAVDGNMYVEEGSLNVGEKLKLADIYVKGEEGENNGIVFQSQGATVNIFGNVMTNQDFLLGKKTKCTVNGSIYGKNVKVGKNDDELRKEADSSELTVGELGSVYTTDDLELNANSSKIKITGNFYGIDDGSFFNKDEDGLSNKSSTIIINSDDLGNLGGNSQLNIDGETIITGVGFIDGIKDPISNLDTEYKTGESIAIKGNYKAYTSVLDEKKLVAGDEDYGKVEFKEFDPLILAWNIEGAKRPLNSQEKSKYFLLYYDQNKNEDLSKGESGLKLKGVVLKGETKSAGVVISEGIIKSQGSMIDDDGNINPIITEKKDIFNKMVNNMGTQTTKGIYPDAPNDIFGNKVNIDKLIEQNKINGETLIYIKKDFNNYELDFSSDKYGNVRKGIIIVNGNLTIKGNMDFAGSIIVSGDLKIIGSKDKTINIKYNKDYVRDLIIQNYFDVFKDVFVNDYKDNNDLVYDIQLNSNYGLDVNKDKLIINKELIKLKNWKIN